MDSVRVLIWPNLSISKDIAADSAFNIINDLITFILKHRDWHFYVAIPEGFETSYVFQHFPNLNTPNITLLPCPMSFSRRLTGYEFDWKAMRAAIKVWDIDLDLIISMLPEYTNTLSQFFSRSTDRHLGHINVPLISLFNWCHSWNNRHEQVQDSRVAFRQFEGDVFADETWSISDFETTLIKELRKRWGNESIINKPIIHLNYGVDASKYDSFISTPKSRLIDGKVRILWNHRNGRYKGTDRFIQLVKDLKTVRNDFIFVLKNPAWCDPSLQDNKIKKFIVDCADVLEVCGPDSLDKSKPDYYKDMAKCDIGFSASKFETWGISILEAAYLDLAILAPANLTFEEMLGNDYKYLYKNKNDMMIKIHELIDEIKLNKNMGCRHHVIDYSWDNLISDWIYYIERAINVRRSQDYTEDADKRVKVCEVAKVYGKPFTKKDLRDTIKYIKPNGKEYTLLTGFEEANWSRQRCVLLKFGFKDDCHKSQPTFYHPDWNKDE